MPPKRAKATSKATGKATGKTAGKKKSTKPAEATEADVKEKTGTLTPSQLDELRSRLRDLRREAEDESKILNESQQEKEKIEQFWGLEKDKREKDGLHLRQKLQQKQDLDERQAFELNVYKQKVKHLLQEQQSHLTDAKIDAEASLTVHAEEQREDTHFVDLNVRDIEKRRKEVQRGHLDLIKSFKQEQEEAIMNLRKEYEQRSRELQALYGKREKEVRSTFQDRRKQDIKEIETRKDAHIHKLMTRHKQAFDDIKNYYRDITHHNLDLIKQLKNKVQLQQKTQQQKDKDVSDISKMHKKLSQPLQQNLELLEQLKVDEKSYERERVALQAANHKLIVLEEQVKNATWEYDILEQKYAQLEEERNELRDGLQESMFDAQQKVGFRNLVMEKKLRLLGEQAEKTDAAIREILLKVNLDPEIVGDFKQNLTDVIADKDTEIVSLEETLQFLQQEFYDTVHAYEAKLGEYDIPLEELGFTPPHI